MEKEEPTVPKTLTLTFDHQVAFYQKLKKKNIHLGELAQKLRTRGLTIEKMAGWIQGNNPVVLVEEWDKVQQKLDVLSVGTPRPRSQNEEDAFIPSMRKVRRRARAELKRNIKNEQEKEKKKKGKKHDRSAPAPE